MIKYICDICGKVIKEHDNKFLIRIESSMSYTHYDLRSTNDICLRDLHVCDGCISKVTEAFNRD